jgi:hypothetical protein
MLHFILWPLISLIIISEINRFYLANLIISDMCQNVVGSEVIGCPNEELRP